MIVLPREGLEHPVFAKVTHDDFLELRVRWGEPLGEAKLGELQERIRDARNYDWGAWGAKKAWMGLRKPAPTAFLPAATPTSCCIVVRGVTTVAPLRALAKTLGEIAPLVETIYVVREGDDDGKPCGARDDARAGPEESTSDEDVYWERSFDTSKPRNMTEDPQGLFAILQTDQGMVTEVRIMQFFLPGFRVSYNLCDVDDGEATPRSREVAASLAKHIERSFETSPPRFFDRNAEQGVVTPISRKGRIGYSFAIERDEMMVGYADGFRYREHELLYATCDACAELDLERAVHWDREDVYILNLWEKLA
jgi:hypothetical protein